MRQAMPSHDELQAVIGRALVDPMFCKDLLNGHRRERLAEFNLTSEEWEAATKVEAADLATFAREIDHWIQARPHAVPKAAQAATVPRPWAFSPAA